MIECPNDANLLQEDLHTLAEWEQQWRMRFHSSKCTNKRNPVQVNYQLHGHILACVSSAKYIGITVTDDLRWDTHIKSICDKANRTIGFLRRNLSVGSVSIKQQAYFSLVRPLVEYASTVWDPYTQANIQKLEMVQQLAARYITSRHRNTSSVSDMLQSLRWRSLEARRKDARLCMMFKTDRELVVIQKEGRLLQPIRHDTRHKHSTAYQPNSSQIDKRKMSFFPRTMRDGNAPPPDIAELKTLEAFKAAVSSLMY